MLDYIILLYRIHRALKVSLGIQGQIFLRSSQELLLCLISNDRVVLLNLIKTLFILNLLRGAEEHLDDPLVNIKVVSYIKRHILLKGYLLVVLGCLRLEIVEHLLESPSVDAIGYSEASRFQFLLGHCVQVRFEDMLDEPVDVSDRRTA